MKLVNLSNDQEIAGTVNVADSFLKRLKGLMFTEKLDSGNGLYINPCQSVHTFFMNYAIDIIYLNEENVVVAIDEELVPGKVGSRFVDAKSVVELPSGTVKVTDTEIGNKLAFII
ncbi:hypothetical protein GCM10011351_15990 [Paraliobacillus quinghaiensis]|uniref:DUF192 domain-containing protein n=1 Tax=Paraliobacillus quinghaiensis TaxID=470815 RepID=A0A917WUT0_9BACI|nr:DUF192 domain-containing protein [Paraliobacillus quinghaiensis]GGM30643.1 hypothetical protein GCM10011351_15990 [Paraliobacillus quinghaiensis]